jgi:hypothetical protein
MRGLNFELPRGDGSPQRCFLKGRVFLAYCLLPAVLELGYPIALSFVPPNTQRFPPYGSECFLDRLFWGCETLLLSLER